MSLKYEFSSGGQRLETEGSMIETVYAVWFLIGSIHANVWDFDRPGQGVSMVIDLEELRKQIELNNINEE